MTDYYKKSKNLYQVCQVNKKLEEVVFHDEMQYNEAYSLKCRLIANEKKYPAGWIYHLERVIE